MARAKSSPDRKETGAVYFRYDHAGDSFSGTLEDKYSFTDEEIKEYIQYSNPALYEQLHGLSLGSSDISKPVPHDTTNDSAHFDISMLELQLKRQIQINLLNRHSFILRKLQARSDPQLCNSPTCLTDGLVFYDTFYLTLKQDIFPHGYTGLHEVSDQTHYCLECLENVFDGKKIGIDAHGGDEKVALDGVGRDQVMKAAARLYNINTSKSTQDISSNDELSPSSISTSSQDRAYEIRLKKQQDIQATVNEVNRYEKQRSASQSSESAIESPPNLVSSRPFYMEAQKDRYRKQGWRRWDKILALRKEGADTQTYQISPTSLAANTNFQAQCYCRESDTGKKDMIKCNNQNCPIGWFHPHCIGPQHDPPEDGKFVCEYCQHDYGPFKPIMTDEEMEIETTTNDLILGQADQCIDHEDEGVDDWDEDEEMEGNDTIMSTMPQWGTPINLARTTNATASPASPSKHHKGTKDSHVFESNEAEDSCYTTDDNQIERFDGLAMVDHTSTSSATGVSTSPNGPTNLLFPGSSQTRFSDLAPFITTDGLSIIENKVFDQWKANLPPSRLICVMMGNGELNNEEMSAHEGTSNSSVSRSPRLSELLTKMLEE